MAALQTPVGTLSFPHLFKPREKAKGATEKVYSAVLMFTPQQMKSPAMKPLRDAVEELARQRFPKLTLGKGVRTPFRLAEEKDEWVPDEFEMFINAWSNDKPGVVDAARNDIADSGDVWPGQHARMVVAPFAYENSGNKGVSLYLHHVQIVRSEGLQRLDNRKPARDAFDDEFDDSDDV
jgi:hypothetical protein